MKFVTCFVLAAATVFAATNPFTELKAPFAPAPEILAAPDADAAWKPLPALASMEGLMAAVAGKTKQEERMTAMRHHLIKTIRVAIAFYQKYPDDPRRWRAVQSISSAIRDLANADGTPKEVLEGITWTPPRLSPGGRRSTPLPPRRPPRPMPRRR